MRKPFHHVNQITPSILTEIFYANEVIDRGAITSVSHRPGPITAPSFSYFLQLGYSPETPPSAPKQLFCKMSKPENDYSTREAFFYNTLSRNLPTVPLVPCYDAAVCEESKSYHVMLEDVSSTHQPANPSFEWSMTLKRPYMEQLIDGLALLHATFWNGLSAPQGKGGLSEAWFRDEYDSLVEDAVYTQHGKTSEDVHAFFDYIGEFLSIEQKSIIEKVVSQLPSLLERRVRQGEDLTVIHHQPHLGNILIPISGSGDIYLIDWASYALWFGADDLTNHIARFWTPHMRREWERDLLDRYHKQLQENGIEHFAWDEFMYDYRLGVMGQLYIRVQGAPDAWDRDTFWKFENVMAAFKELECEALLD